MVHSALNHSQQRMLVPASPITAPRHSASSPANNKISQIPSQLKVDVHSLVSSLAPFPVIGPRDTTDSGGTDLRLSWTLLSELHHHTGSPRTLSSHGHIHAGDPKALGDDPWLTALPVHVPNPPQQARSLQSKEAKLAGSSEKSRPATVQAHKTG